MTALTPSEQQVYDVLKNLLVTQFEVPEDKVKPEARIYEDFDIDSIDAVDMIVQLRPYLGGRRVSPEQFKQVRTMEDLVKVIAKLLETPAP